MPDKEHVLHIPFPELKVMRASRDIVISEQGSPRSSKILHPTIEQIKSPGTAICYVHADTRFRFQI